MAKMTEIHVTPRGGGLLGWAVKVNGRRVSWFTVKSSAVACAIFLSRVVEKASLKIHDGRGRVSEERTYPRAADPTETPG